MTNCRIYLFTYKRNTLLKRAIQSLLSQTFTNWICEVHNDDPNDNFPSKNLQQLNDPRFIIHNHPTNLGAVSSFNLAFTNCKEEFAAMLEDDNWWEPEFLQTAIGALNVNPITEVLVGNERIWLERKDNSWFNTGKTVWPEADSTTLFQYNLEDKCGLARICNSSMVWRTNNAQNWKTPADIPVDVTEHFRERLLPHPILLLDKPLVNFAQTQHTNRSNSVELWSSYQVLLIASIFENATSAEAKTLSAKLWCRAQENPLYKTSLLHAALSGNKSRILFKHVSIKEVFRYLLTVLKNPARWYAVKRAPQRYSSQWHYLLGLDNHRA